MNFDNFPVLGKDFLKPILQQNILKYLTTCRIINQQECNTPRCAYIHSIVYIELIKLLISQFVHTIIFGLLIIIIQKATE